MGEVNPEPTTREVQDVTAINVDPALGERLYKAAVIQSHQGTTVRVLSKTLASGKIDVVHYACDLDPDGTPQGKRRIHRITAVALDQFNSEFPTIQKNLTETTKWFKVQWFMALPALRDFSPK